MVCKTDVMATRSWYWRPILNAIRQFKTRQIDDPHYQKMRVYR